MLASQPMTPPMTNHKMIPIVRLLYSCASVSGLPSTCLFPGAWYSPRPRLDILQGTISSVHARIAFALIGVQLVVERLEAAAQHVGGAALVSFEVFQRGKDE